MVTVFGLDDDVVVVLVDVVVLVVVEVESVVAWSDLAHAIAPRIVVPTIVAAAVKRKGRDIVNNPRGGERPGRRKSLVSCSSLSLSRTLFTPKPL